MNNTIGLDDREQFSVVIARTFSAFLALVGSLYIIVSMLYYRRLRYQSVRLIFFLSIMSVCESTVNLLTYTVWSDAQTGIYSEMCLAQAIVMQFSQVAEFGWITVIAVNLYLEVGKAITTKEWIYHLCVWFFAFMCTILPFTKQGSYGFTGLWCWLTTEGQIFRWLLFYVPLSLFWVVVVVLYWMTRTIVKKKLKGLLQSVESKRQTRRKTAFSMAYPAVFIILYIFPLLNRFYGLFDHRNIFVVTLLQTLTAPLLGFANAVVYWLKNRQLHGIEHDEEYMDL